MRMFFTEKTCYRLGLKFDLIWPYLVGHFFSASHREGGGSLIPDTWTPETFQSQVLTDQLEDGSRPQVLPSGK